MTKISLGLALKLAVGFFGFDLKTDSYGLVIGPQNHSDGLLVYASKSSKL
jgi:hypothetical protein